MFKWKLLKDASPYGYMGETFIMRVPNGYVLKHQHEDRPGRGPEYQQHPIGVQTSMVFIPSDQDWQIWGVK